MPRLTAQHFRWLATAVAEDIDPRKLDSYIRKVKAFSKNSKFKPDLFRDRCTDTLKAKEYDEGLDPELYNGRY